MELTKKKKLLIQKYTLRKKVFLSLLTYIFVFYLYLEENRNVLHKLKIK